MIIWILFVVGGALGTLLIHEATHVVVNTLLGGKVITWKPYPHWSGGKFWFGRTRTEWPDILPKRHAWTHIAPFIVSSVLASAWTAGGLFYAPLWALAGTSAIDVLWWWYGYFFGSSRADGQKWRRR